MNGCRRCARVVRVLCDEDQDADEMLDLIEELYRAEIKQKGGLAPDDEGEDPLG